MGIMSDATEAQMSSPDKIKAEVDPVASRLSERDVRTLLIICTELVNFCANVTKQIDPAAAAMLTYVRDDIRSESKSLSP